MTGTYLPWIIALASLAFALSVALGVAWRSRQLAHRWHDFALAEQGRLIAFAPSLPTAQDASRAAPASHLEQQPIVDAVNALGVKMGDLVVVMERCAVALERKSAPQAPVAVARCAPATPATSSVFDPLTGAVTWAALMTRLITDVEFSRKHQRPLALALFDINGFRAINERHGFTRGDEVLAAVADRLRGDLGDGDLLARLGVDRFVVVWPDTDFSQAQSRVERILAAFARGPLALAASDNALNDAEPIAVTLRAGVVLCPDDGHSATALVELAEHAVLNRPRSRHDVPSLPPAPRAFDVADSPAHSGAQFSAPITPAGPISYIDSMTQRHSSIQALTAALESHDPEGIIHARNLAELAEETALLLARPIEEARLVGLAALLHDVGNLGIPIEILTKTDPLTPEEWSFVKKHPHLGERLLTSVGGVLAAVAPIVASHRERWDGSGYPTGLAGESIPLGARIVAVCDVYGALISSRPYRPANTFDEAVAELRAHAGTQFDPHVVEAFITALTR